MAIRRLCAVLALVAMGIIGTAGVAAAADYPPTTGSVSTEAASTVAPSTTVSASAASTGLPFTGGNSLVLVWLGVACVGAGTLAVVRTRRRRSHV